MSQPTVQSLYDALDRTLDAFREATDGDGFLSYKDVRRTLPTLPEPDRTLFDLLHQHMRLEESEEPYSRITETDFKAAEDFVVNVIIPRFDLAPAGLSVGETTRFSELEGVALSLAAQLKRTAQAGTQQTSTQLFEHLRELVDGLFFDYMGSEAGIAIEAVRIEANLGELNETTFSTLLNLDTSNPKEKIERFVDAAAFLNIFPEQHEPFDLGEAAAEVVQLMRNDLNAISIFVLGEDNHPALESEHPVYVVGISSEGDLVGLKSIVIWT